MATLAELPPIMSAKFTSGREHHRRRQRDQRNDLAIDSLLYTESLCGFMASCSTRSLSISDFKKIALIRRSFLAHPVDRDLTPRVEVYGQSFSRCEGQRDIEDSYVETRHMVTATEIGSHEGDVGKKRSLVTGNCVSRRPQKLRRSITSSSELSGRCSTENDCPEISCGGRSYCPEGISKVAPFIDGKKYEAKYLSLVPQGRKLPRNVESGQHQQGCVCHDGALAAVGDRFRSKPMYHDHSRRGMLLKQTTRTYDDGGHGRSFFNQDGFNRESTTVAVQQSVQKSGRSCMNQIAEFDQSAQQGLFDLSKRGQQLALFGCNDHGSFGRPMSSLLPRTCNYRDASERELEIGGPPLSLQVPIFV